MQSVGVKYGLLGGVFSVLLMTLLYVTGKSHVVGNELWLVWVVIISAMFASAWQARKSLGGFISFKDALKEGFAAFSIATIIYLAYYGLLINFIDPSLSIEFRNYALAHIESNKDMMDEVTYLKKLKEAKDTSIYYPTLGGMLISFVQFAPFGFIISALISFVVRREEEVYR